METFLDFFLEAEYTRLKCLVFYFRGRNPLAQLDYVQNCQLFHYLHTLRPKCAVLPIGLFVRRSTARVQAQNLKLVYLHTPLDKIILLCLTSAQHCNETAPKLITLRRPSTTDSVVFFVLNVTKLLRSRWADYVHT